MNDTEKFRHFSVINDFLRRHEDYTPENRKEYEKFKQQLLSLNAPLKKMNKRDLLVRKKNTELINMFIETRKRFHAIERKERSKGLVDITSPKVKAYLDEFNLVKKAANTPIPQVTPSPIEIEQEESTAVSCKSCFGRRSKTKKNKGEREIEGNDFYGGKRRRRKRKTRKKKKTRKQRGGVKRWRREPQEYTTKDDMGYFYDCQPTMDNPSNKSKYRENMIITGDRDGNELMLPDEWKIIRMEDSQFYDPQLQLVDMALPEGERGMRWFRRRAQSLCNRGYKPLKRNDAKTGAGRKKKTRKKRGGEKSKKIKKLTKIFQQYPKIFPSGYFRFLAARLENHINKNTLWYRNGVVLTWIKYQKTVKKNDKCIIKPGDVKLDQIVNKNQGNGAAKKVVMQFLKKFEKNRIWLEVRANNKRAIRFYRKNGFKKVCNIKFGEIKGIMMVKN